VDHQVGGTSLCFVAAHLAAHSDHVQRRNADVTEILSGTKARKNGLNGVVVLKL
jgi:hypothetical protein